jgi:hypothetical protein
MKKISILLLLLIALSGCNSFMMGSQQNAEIMARTSCGRPPLSIDEIKTYGLNRALERYHLMHGDDSGCIHRAMSRWGREQDQNAADMRMIARQHGFAVPYRLNRNGSIN